MQLIWLRSNNDRVYTHILLGIGGNEVLGYGNILHILGRNDDPLSWPEQAKNINQDLN